jgi:hypothetical protein
MRARFCLTLQSFGSEREYRRAILAIFSFLVFYKKNDFRIVIFTDYPDWFRPWLVALPVDYEHLSPARISNMRGSIDFLHRMKIAEIEQVMSTSGCNMLYTDSDTFFTGNPDTLLDELDEKMAFMHLREYSFSDMDIEWYGEYGTTMRKFIDLIKSHQLFTESGRPFRITLQDSSWNAGVIMLHHSHSSLLPTVYTLTDQIFSQTRNHASEQYAFSLVLQRATTLKSCDSVIYHYWSRVKKQIADEFLDKYFDKLQAQNTLEGKLSVVKYWISILPLHFSNHYLRHRDDAIQHFTENAYAKALRHVFQSFLRRPLLDWGFIRDILYHTKIRLKKIF